MIDDTVIDARAVSLREKMRVLSAESFALRNIRERLLEVRSTDSGDKPVDTQTGKTFTDVRRQTIYDLAKTDADAALR